jgi:protein CpxP
MKLRSILALVLVLAGFSFAFAQPGPGGPGGQQMSAEERAKAAVEKIKGPLSLNEDQEKSTLEVFTEYYKGFDKFREQMRSGGRPDPTAFQGLTDERDVKLKKIITKEQYKKFKNEVEDTLRPQRGPGGGRGTPPPPREQ